MSGFKHILVPVDYSPSSTAALSLAGKIATAFDGRLIALNLVPIEIQTFGGLPIAETYTVRLDEERERLHAHVIDVLGSDGPPFEIQVSWGSPFLRIVDHAIEGHADLIVMGTHGRRGIRHALLGSVAEKTVRMAPCPVLTVREDAVIPHALAAAERPAGRSATARGSVGALMTPNPIAVSSTDTLDLAQARMIEAGARHLPVVDGTKLVGIITDRDMQPYVGHLAHARVNVAMRPDPTIVSPDVAATTAARRMLEDRVRALPVVDGERVVGMLSVTDVLEEFLAARE